MCGDAQLLAIVEERLGAGGEEDGREKLGDGEVVLSVGVAAHAALEAGAVRCDKRNGVADRCDVFGGLDSRADGGWIERGDRTEAGVEEKLRDVGIRCFVGALLRRGAEGRVDVADEDAGSEVVGGGFAEFGGLSVSFGSGADDVKAGDAAVEPETGYVGKIGGGNFGVEVEQDANVVAAGLVDEVVKIVEGAVG